MNSMLEHWRSQSQSSKLYALPLVDAGKLDDGVERILTEAQIERYELPVNIARTCAYGLIAMFMVLVLWSALAQIDVVARAPGQLRPYGKPKLVQSELNGKVRRIIVGEGTHVKQNAPLVELDSTLYQNELDERKLAMQQEKVKLQQLQEGRQAVVAIIKTPDVLPALPSDLGDVSQVVNDVYSTQKTLAQARYDAGAGSTKAGQFAGDMANLSDMMTQLGRERDQKKQQVVLLRGQNQKEEAQKQASIASLKQQITSHDQLLDETKQALDTAQQQERDYEKVLDVGVSQVQFLDVKQKVGECRKRLLEEKSTISNLQNQLQIALLDLPRWKLASESEILRIESEANNAISNLKDVQIRMRGSTKNLEQAQAQADAALEHARAALSDQTAQIISQQELVQQREKSLEETQHVLNQAMVCAPMTGTVTGLVVRAPGEVVTAGEQLMQIIPDQSDIVIEATVNNADIGFVRSGQDVKVKLDAFPYQDFGVLDGTVWEIEQYPEADQTRGYVYLVRIRPSRMEISAGNRMIRLKEGLTGECDIILRKMTVLQALLRPFARFGYLNIKA